MSVNSAILDEQTNQPLPLNSLEKFLFDTDEIDQFSFICGRYNDIYVISYFLKKMLCFMCYYDNIANSLSGYPGSTLGYASKSGRFFITDHRIVFLSSPQLPFFQSFTCPFNKIYDLSIQTPSKMMSFFKKCPTILSAKIIPVTSY